MRQIKLFQPYTDRFRIGVGLEESVREAAWWELIEIERTEAQLST